MFDHAISRLACSKWSWLLKKPSWAVISACPGALEGKFSVKNKSSGHPHTNMAKAALNMMTHTACKDGPYNPTGCISVLPLIGGAVRVADGTFASIFEDMFRRRILMNCASDLNRA